MYENLVLCGGGVLGISFCGALEEFHKRGILASIVNYAGSSAGSIIAGALACGASFNFIMREMSAADFSSFIDYGGKVRAAYNLYQYMGICPGTVFMDWYGGLIEKLTGDGNITLAQVHEKYGGRLVITATNVNTRRVAYMDYESHPGLPLKTAVRMSMSIPFIFVPVQHGEATWVDGGVLDNFPMRAFHTQTAESDIINPKTIGLMLMAGAAGPARPVKVDSLWAYINALLGCYMSQTQKTYMDPQDWARTIKIPCGEVSSFNFYIDEKTKAELVVAGRDAVIRYFDTPGVTRP